MAQPAIPGPPAEPPPPPLSRLRRLGLFLLVVFGAGVAGALVEWTVRWVLPAGPSIFIGRVAATFPIFYWMPVILAESPPWSRRRRARLGLVVAILASAAAWALSA